MGLHSLDENVPEIAKAEEQESNGLDAFGKGRGKGKGNNDGRCNTCGGDGRHETAQARRHRGRRNATDVVTRDMTRAHVRRQTQC